MWGLRLNSCICECQRVCYCHSFVQLPAKHDLLWFGKSIARITQPTYWKMAENCIIFLEIFSALYFRHSISDAIIMVCPVIICGSWCWILVCVIIRGCFSIIPLYNYLPEMSSDDLDKALVPKRNQLIKNNWKRNWGELFWKYFGTRSLTQLLWYARPSYVGVAPELLISWV